ncbi:putative PPC domain-containing protein [Medicago truncatula]|uniref:Putative PPC domain-containing protein n=1 Tax=Medicago truncatula TaxID=3880 RepID=A0A396JGD0_MEDTR|nr:putative PPC domain-containing protein [Medicago truncatula]
MCCFVKFTFISLFNIELMYCSYQHIYTSNGVSLHELSLSQSKDRRFSFFFWYPDRRFSANDNNDLYTTNLSQGEDVVDALYRLSEAFHHHRLVSIDSVSGYVSDVLFHDQDGSHAHTGVFEITSLSLQCLADEDGHQCQNKATCSVLLTDDKGNTFEITGVNSLIANGPIEIIAELEKEKSAGESSSSAAAAAAAGDGNLNPTTTTTGAANDQDK